MSQRAVREFGTELLGNLLDLVYPPECAWCGDRIRADQRLCSGCRNRFLSDYYRCLKCATPLPRVVPNADCYRCRDTHWRFSQVITLAPYRGDMRRAVISIKKRRFETLRRALGELLGEKLLAEPQIAAPPGEAPCGQTSQGAPPLLIPVPYHWSHHFSSAAATAESLARAIAHRTHWPVANHALRRIRKTSKQGLLSWTERSANVRNAFSVRVPAIIAGRRVLLVDDVLTSGATAAELSRILLRAGAASVAVVVAARATGVREAESIDQHPPSQSTRPANPPALPIQ